MKQSKCCEEGCSKDEGQHYGKIYLPTRSDKISVQSEDVDLLNEDDRLGL